MKIGIIGNPGIGKTLTEINTKDSNETKEVEVSLGMFTENDMEEGEYEGKQYKGIAKNHRPDHLAILPDQIGACSCKDGCGLGANKKDEEIFHLNSIIHKLELENKYLKNEKEILDIKNGILNEQLNINKQLESENNCLKKENNCLKKENEKLKSICNILEIKNNLISKD